MIISIKQDNLTVAVELEEDGYEKSVSCEELLLAAYDAISRIFTQKPWSRRITTQILTQLT